MARDKFYESDSPTRWSIGIFGQVVLWVIGIGLLGAAVWGFKVITSDAKGAGDATRITNGGSNRLQSEAEFNERWESITRYEQDINQAQADLVDAQGREEDLDFYRENLSGAKRMCLNAVNEYNALGGDPQKAKWRPAELPSRASSDCEPTNAPTLAPTGTGPQTGAGEPSPRSSN